MGWDDNDKTTKLMVTSNSPFREGDTETEELLWESDANAACEEIQQSYSRTHKYWQILHVGTCI